MSMKEGSLHERDLTRMLTLTLRHGCDHVIPIDENGWMCVNEVLMAINANAGRVGLWKWFSLRQLTYTVGRNKDRFEIRGRHVRALYGHSLSNVVVGERKRPPSVLYHGTSANRVAAILVDGLQPGKRTFVHLTSDVAYAEVVGEQIGQPAILEITARRAAANGIEFRQANDHVWLTSIVPAVHLHLKSSASPLRPSGQRKEDANQPNLS